jgi:uncharacterized protein YbgA (DUF1722 family)
MAHSTVAYRDLGRLVAGLKHTPRAVFREQYGRGFMEALAHVASRGRIHDYRQSLVPLVVPVTLIAHHVRHHEVEYLNGQVFLEPHPRELMLRNHV